MGENKRKPTYPIPKIDRFQNTYNLNNLFAFSMFIEEIPSMKYCTGKNATNGSGISLKVIF